MALNFPANPVDGQLYPDPAPAGSTQYVYNSTKGTWLTVFRGVDEVTGSAPIVVTGDRAHPIVGITPATTSSAGSMSAADKLKLDALDPGSEGVTKIIAGIGLGAPNTGASIVTEGTINLLAPTIGSIGGVKAGDNVNIAADGTLTIKAPSTATIGGVKQGPGMTIAADGTISLAPGSTYTVLDDLGSQFNGITTSFNMTVNGIAYAPSAAKGLMIFLDGVFQVPLVAFNVIGGSILEFTTAPSAGVSFYGISLT